MGFITIAGGGGFITKFFWMLIAVLTLGVDGKLAVRDDATYNVSVSEAAANDMEADDFENIDTMSMMQLKEKVAKQQAMLDAQKQELSDRAAEVRRLEAKLDNLDDMYKTNLAHSIHDQSGAIPKGWFGKENRGYTCTAVESDKCGTKCAKLKYSGWKGCSSITSAEVSDDFATHCKDWYEWGTGSWKVCRDHGDNTCKGQGETCGHT